MEPFQEKASADIVAGNVAKLKAIFPEAFAEGKIDFEVLKQVLGGIVDEREEKYGLNWHGKRRARQLALTPSTGTLRPCPQDSIDWDTTKNLMIEGDNLEVLKLLQKSYLNKVKLIYIDPPYNTGNDFVYPDDFTDNIKNYQQLTGQIDAEGNKLSGNTESSGRFHTDWLNMMYPRLKLARNLLRDDGVIFISIDDNEANNLREICDNIFGEENFLGQLIWNLRSGPQAGHFTRSHEYLLTYVRNKEALSYFADRSGGAIIHGALKKISSANPASDVTFPVGFEFEGTDAIFKGEIGDSEKQFILDDAMVFKNGKLAKEVTIKAGWGMRNQLLSWLSGKETVDSKGQKVKRFFFNKSGILCYEKERTTIHPKTVLPDAVGNTKTGSDELIDLLGNKPLNFPKPSSIIKFLVDVVSGQTDIILDFFAGSGTTGHAVMSQNSTDGGNRRYILVQLPEKLNPENAEQKVAADFCDKLGKPRNIAELTKERLRRAAKKIQEENSLFKGDLGFRVFKLDSTNIREWDPDRNNLEQSVQLSIDHLKADRAEDDILYELLLKLGLDLAIPIEQKGISGKTVYSIGAGTLIACLATAISAKEVEPLAHGIIAWHKALAPAGDTTIVFRDSAFADDIAKTNLTAILEQSGLTNVRSI